MSDLNLTAKEYREYQKTGKLPTSKKKRHPATSFADVNPTSNGSPIPSKGTPRPNPRPKQIPGRMNKTEQAFVREYLDPLLQSGEIYQWLFEPFSLRLANHTHYRPDFVTVGPNGIDVYEVKGTHVEDDSRAKWKIAANEFWWMKFFMVKIKMKKGAIVDMNWEEYKR